jgi:PAS domain S-box-containing protein
MTDKLSQQSEQIEEDLAKNPYGLNALFDHALDAMLLADDNGYYIEANSAACRLLGYTRNELRLLAMPDITPISKRPRASEIWQALMSVGKSSGEFTLLHKDDTLIQVEYHAVSNVVPAVHLLVLRDITSQKQAEEALSGRIRESEIAYQQAVIYARELKAEIAERKRAEEAIRRHVAQLEILCQIGLELTAELDLDSLLHAIIARAIKLLQGVAGGLFLYRPEPEVLELSAAISSHPIPPGVILQQGEDVAGQVWAKSQPLIIDNYSDWPDKVAIFANLPYSAVAGAPLHWGQKFLGVIIIFAYVPRTFSPADSELLSLFATQAAITLENARLFEAEHAAREQLSNLASYLQAAREEERAHIAREIHDEFGQALTALKMDLTWIAKRLADDESGLRQKAAVMSELIDTTMHMVRSIATELRPGILDDLGLGAAIEWQTQEFAKRTGLEYTLRLDNEELVLERDLATAIFRVFQEILTNIARHARASRVSIELKEKPSQLILRVRDDGLGITPKQISDPKSLGLIGMRERVNACGGTITLCGMPNRGTIVTVRIPQTHKKERNREGA